MTDHFSDHPSDEHNEYSFLADQLASGQSADFSEQTTESCESPTQSFETETQSFEPETVFSDGPTATLIRKEPSRFKKGLRRGLAWVGAAAVFGGVAAGAFIGFNELYYRLNPLARPSDKRYSVEYTVSPSANTGLLASTAVSSSTSVATADVSTIVEKNMPSLVTIYCRFRTTTNFFGYLYENTTEGSGSGIIIGKNDKELLIATNNHVVNDALSTEITFSDGTIVSASVRGTDASADLAIVSVALEDIPAETQKAITIATIGSSNDIKVGQMVIAIGNALGYGQTTTVGYLSAKDREISVSDSSGGKNTDLTVLQVDAAINPGNSGGALLNTAGEVIGINSAKLSSTSVEGIGYAIPIDSAMKILDELMNREILTEEEQGYLGIYLSQTEITEEVASLYGFPLGVYVADVVKNGAADRCGIYAGDVITAINGTKVTSRTALQEKVGSYRSGVTIEVTLYRLEDGVYTEHTLEVTLGSKSDFD